LNERNRSGNIIDLSLDLNSDDEGEGLDVQLAEANEDAPFYDSDDNVNNPPPSSEGRVGTLPWAQSLLSLYLSNTAQSAVHINPSGSSVNEETQEDDGINDDDTNIDAATITDSLTNTATVDE
jgi:hypothetical protein